MDTIFSIMLQNILFEVKAILGLIAESCIQPLKFLFLHSKTPKDHINV